MWRPGRLRHYTFTTPALAGPTPVRVLWPAGYSAHPRRRYPVLYLLHGASQTSGPDIGYTRW